MTQVNIQPGNWQNWSHFFPGPAIRGLEATHHLWYYGNNVNSPILSESNGHALAELRDQRGIPEEDFQVEGCSKGALRGTEIYGVIARVRNEDGTETKAAKLLAEVQRSLDNYPILDDDDYSTRVSDANFKLLEEELRYHELEWDYESDVCEATGAPLRRYFNVASEVSEYLSSLGGDSMNYEDWFPEFHAAGEADFYREDGDVYEALIALGYTRIEEGE